MSDPNDAGGVNEANGPGGVTTDEYFGGCPVCGGSDGYSNIGPDHWGSCDAHRVKWPIGWNLFSSWKDEAPEVWERNRQDLAGYRTVVPLRPRPEPQAAAAGAVTEDAAPPPGPADFD